MGQATLDYGLFFGTRSQAESFAVGMEQVFTNRAMLNAQLPGYSYLLPHAQLVLKSRLLAPPLSPLQIVTILLPQLAGGPQGAIQSLRVRYTIPANIGYGYNGMLVGYEYIFMPGRDPAFASQAHPVLRTQTQVLMQGAAFIVTFPHLPSETTWTFGYRILSVPQAVFQNKKIQATYVAIFDSFELIPKGLAQRVRSNEEAAKLADSMNHTTHEVAQNWWAQLGAGGEAAGGESATPQPARPESASSGSPSGEKSCSQAPYKACPPYWNKYCCQDQRGAPHLTCVPKTASPPAESSYNYNCKPMGP